MHRHPTILALLVAVIGTVACGEQTTEEPPTIIVADSATRDSMPRESAGEDAAMVNTTADVAEDGSDDDESLAETPDAGNDEDGDGDDEQVHDESILLLGDTLLLDGDATLVIVDLLRDAIENTQGDLLTEETRENVSGSVHTRLSAPNLECEYDEGEPPYCSIFGIDGVEVRDAANGGTAVSFWGGADSGAKALSSILWVLEGGPVETVLVCDNSSNFTCAFTF